MIVELGHFALVLAVITALIQTVIPLYGAHVGDRRLMTIGSTAAVVQFALIAASFLALTAAFVASDFSVAAVVANSHTTKPLIYKISGVWGNHEGSMLLWVLMVALFGAAVALFGHNLPDTLKARVLAVQASIALAFGIFILATSNPFARMFPPPVEGQGLNPILQDPALAFHPPFLYAGYVGLSIAYSFAIAALIEGRTDGAWGRWVRPWTLAAWMCLTIGIAMGSWWAYYTLGWGGWWFWDPVENASLMPWLAATALLHSAVVMEKRGSLKVWTVLLAILAFSLSLMGTFLVRSGVLTSVHSFAVDPARGLVILGILTIFTGGGFAMFAFRAGELRNGGMFAIISREGGLIVNNVLLSVSAFTVFCGTLYPLLTDALGMKISVGAPYFNMTFTPLMALLLVVVPIGSMLAWKRGDLDAALQRLRWAAIAAAVAFLLAVVIAVRGPWLAPFAMALGTWVMAGAATDLAGKIRLGAVSLPESLRRLTGLPRSALGTTVAHAGVGLMVIGITATSAYQSENILVMKPGEQTQLAGYTLTLKGVEKAKGPNYRATVGELVVTRGSSIVTTLTPEIRRFDRPRQSTSAAGIHTAWRGDLYTVLGEAQEGGGHTIRLYFNPLVRFIWLGGVIMFLGGLLSLSDRRLRIGAPIRRPTPTSLPTGVQAAE